MRVTATGFVFASLLLLIAATPASAQKAIDITPSYIAGAKLGWTGPAYRKHFGTMRTDQLEGGYTRLVAVSRKIAVYLKAGRGVAITTWSRRLVDENGITPCATLADLESAWGDRMRIVRFAGKIQGYRVGRVLYATRGTKRVQTVMLSALAKYDFIAFNELACR